MVEERGTKEDLLLNGEEEGRGEGAGGWLRREEVREERDCLL